MNTTITPEKLNHLNLVLEDFHASVAHFCGLYGAEFMADIPNQETHACLIEIGRVIFELFIPNAWLLTARYGPHYVGVEYQADIEQVRAAIAERGIRIVRDIGIALHTHPADTLGVAFEFYDGEFHDRTWDALGGRKMHTADHWRDVHPLGVTGLQCVTLAVNDLTQAQRFLESFLAAEPLYETGRPAVGGQAVGLRVADATIELLAPDGPGELERHLRRYGEGIRSTVFGVRELEAVRRYFAERYVALSQGTADGALAVAGEANLGVIFEFAAP